MDEPLDEPPAISTRPSGSRVAECWARGAVMLPLGVNAPEDCAIAIVALPKGAETRRIRNRAQKDTVTLLVMRCTTTRIIFFNRFSRPGDWRARSAKVRRHFARQRPGIVPGAS